MSPKIGILCTYTFPEGMAPTIRILTYGKGLVENGANVEVVIYKPLIGAESNSLSGFINGIKYTYSHNRDPQKSCLYKLFVDRPKSLFNALRILLKSNKIEKYTCVLLSFDDPVYQLFFAPLLRMFGFNVGFIGDEFPEPIRRLKNNIPWYYVLSYKIAYKFINFRVLMTEALKEFYDLRICKKPTYILSSVIDTSRFDGLISQSDCEPYLCYMGNMMLSKDNVDNIIRAFNLIKNDFPDICLRLYGTPNNEDRRLLEDLIARNSLENRVCIKGRIDYNQVPQVLASALILLTSQPNTKRAAGGFPTKLAEYMMSKIPSIVTDVGEICCYVKDSDTVYVVPPCDEVAYADKIKYVLEHPDEAKSVAIKAYDYAKTNFGAKDVTKPLLEFIIKL